MTDYITISELRKAPTRLLRSVSVGKKEYIVTSNGLPIFKIVKPLPLNLDKKVSVKTMRDSLANFQNLLEENGVLALTAYGKHLARCIKL
jgi:prevent-host-death family protein